MFGAAIVRGGVGEDGPRRKDHGAGGPLDARKAALDDRIVAELEARIAALEQAGERKEAQILERESLFRLFLNHAPVALAMFDRDMRYLAASRRWREDLGLGEQNLFHRSHYEVFPEIPDAWKDVHRRGMAGEVVRAEADRFVRADGSVQWLRREVRPWHEAQGAVGGILIFSEEITARMQTETALRYSELRYRTLIDHALPDALYVHDHTGRLIEVNDKAAEITGYSRGELLRMNVAEVEVDLGLEALQEAWAAMPVGPTQHFHGHHRRKDGTSFPVEVHISILETEGERLYIGLVRDISERQRVEHAVRSSEQRFSDIVAASADWVWEVDTQGRYTFVSEGVRSLLGYEPEQLLGREPWDLMPPDEAVRVRAMHQAIASERRSVRDVDNVNLHKDGSLRYLQTTAMPILDDDGTLLGYRGIDRDVTEKRLAEIALRESHANLERRVAERTAEVAHASQAKSEFLARLSHEVRTPLNPIIGFSQLLQEGMAGPISDRQKELIRHIHSAGQHLLALITDVLDLSKIEAGRLQLEPQPIEVAATLESGALIAKEKAMSQRLEFAMAVAPETGNIVADPRAVKQIVFNLLSNAVKHTPEGGRILLGARRCGAADVRLTNGRPGRMLDEALTQAAEYLEVSIEDFGAGISEPDLARLCEPFVQLDNEGTRRHGGSGLGLSLVRRLAGLHGGALAIESSLGAGSIFRVWLPYSQA